MLTSFQGVGNIAVMVFGCSFYSLLKANNLLVSKLDLFFQLSNGRSILSWLVSRSLAFLRSCAGFRSLSLLAALADVA